MESRQWQQADFMKLPGFDGGFVDVNVGGAGDGSFDQIQQTIHGQGPQPEDEAYGQQGKLWTEDPRLDKNAWRQGHSEYNQAA